MDEFISSICDKLQSLKVQSVTLLRVQRWGKDKYPNMRELEYGLDVGEDHCAVLELFAELFPALTSLTPHTDRYRLSTDTSLTPHTKINRLRTDMFTQLRRLDLKNCKVFDLKENKSLEELIIDFGPDSADFNFDSLMFPQAEKTIFQIP